MTSSTSTLGCQYFLLDTDETNRIRLPLDGYSNNTDVWLSITEVRSVNVRGVGLSILWTSCFTCTGRVNRENMGYPKQVDVVPISDINITSERCCQTKKTAVFTIRAHQLCTGFELCSFRWTTTDSSHAIAAQVSERLYLLSTPKTDSTIKALANNISNFLQRAFHGCPTEEWCSEEDIFYTFSLAKKCRTMMSWAEGAPQ